MAGPNKGYESREGVVHALTTTLLVFALIFFSGELLFESGRHSRFAGNVLVATHTAPVLLLAHAYN